MGDDAPKEPVTLSELDARLRIARGTVRDDEAARSERALAQPKGVGVAARIVLEMVVTVLVGAAIGVGLDRWLGTAPWLMVVFLFLGAAAGVSNVYRVAKGLDDSVGLGLAIERKRRQDAEAAAKSREDGDV